jgi:hypothetical protein
MIASHPSQEKAQIICSIIDFIEADFALSVLTAKPSSVYIKVLLDVSWLLAVVDICSLLDNLFKNTSHDQSLLEYWKNGFSGYALLDGICRVRNLALEANLFEIRNTLAAHIDQSSTISNLCMKFESCDVTAIHAYCHWIVNGFYQACAADFRTTIFCARNVPIEGACAVAPDLSQPFDK